MDALKPAAGMPGRCNWCASQYHELCGEAGRTWEREVCSCICPMPWEEGKEVTEADAKAAAEFMAEYLDTLYVDSVDLVANDENEYAIVVNSLVEDRFPPVPAHMAPIPVMTNVVDI